MRAFIIRPFGVRKGIDFEAVEKSLIDPALDRVQAEGRTTGEILEAGNIRIAMFEQLLTADLVIADITTNNPNAFYELGIRHALQEKRTFLLRARTSRAQTIEEFKEFEVPFDLKTDRYFEYDPADPGASLEKLTGALRETVANIRQDSPVFLSLPNLRPQPRERFTPVPQTFGEEVQLAEKEKDTRKLTLLSLEVRGFPWEATGLRVTGRALSLIKQNDAAKIVWEALRDLDEYDLEANLALGNTYQRSGDLVRADQALQRAKSAATTPADLAEIYGQLGRNKKDRWFRSWADRRNTEERARKALDSPLLMEAYREYLAAYRQDLNAYYPGINALFLAVILLDLAGRYPEIWSAPFGDENEASRELDAVRRKREQIAQALQLRFDEGGAPALQAASDIWLLSSAGDLSLLVQPPNARRAAWFYQKAAAAGDFVLDSVRRQLALLSQLGVLTPQIEEVLKVFPPALAHPVDECIGRVLLFSGHRVDSAGRGKPRFPAARESIAREAIRAAIEEEAAIAGGPVIGVAGGANGGDLLFLEVCQELGIRTEMLLALPENQFIQARVDHDDKSWLRRFRAQMLQHPHPPELAQSTELPRWLQFKRGYNLWQRNNIWLLSEALCLAPAHVTVIALCNGEPGDDTDGTRHMAGIARDRGARVITLDSKKLFELP